jgi:hypothetical protein
MHCGQIDAVGAADAGSDAAAAHLLSLVRLGLADRIEPVPGEAPSSGGLHSARITQPALGVAG